MSKALIAMVAVLTLVAAGWMGVQPQVRPPIHVLAGVDRSLSAEPQLGQYARTLADLAATLEEQDRLTLYRFDHDCQEFYDDHTPDDIEQFKGLLLESLRPAPGQRGTRPALFLKTVAERLAQSDRAVVVVMFSDGGNDDYNTIPLYRESARRLAQNTNLKRLVVMGSMPAQRQELRDFLAPLEGRLDLYGPQEITVERLLAPL